NPEKSIEWALGHGRTVIVTDGEYGAEDRIEVPRPDVTLIVAEGATIRPAEDADMDAWPELRGNQGDLFRQLIYNKGHDGVRIINFGTLAAPPTWFGRHSDEGHAYNSSAAIWYDGRQGGGSGITGGLVFSPGKIVDADNHGHGVAIHDVEAVRVPFLHSVGMGHALLWMAGCRRCSVGTVVNIPTEGAGEGESLDMTAYNEDNVIDTVIGLGETSPRDEVLDINASPDNVIGQVIGWADIKDMVTITDGCGMRFSEREASPNSNGTRIGSRVVLGKPRNIRKAVDAPGEPAELDRLDVTARFIVTDSQGRTFSYGGTQHVNIGD
ncbi:MAG: hypothetical protein V5A84_04495, partial [Planctomycetota bacterium]